MNERKKVKASDLIPKDGTCLECVDPNEHQARGKRYRAKWYAQVLTYFKVLIVATFASLLFTALVVGSINSLIPSDASQIPSHTVFFVLIGLALVNLAGCFIKYNVIGSYLYVFPDENGRIHYHLQNPDATGRWYEWLRQQDPTTRCLLRLRFGGWKKSSVLIHRPTGSCWRVHSWNGLNDLFLHPSYMRNPKESPRIYTSSIETAFEIIQCGIDLMSMASNSHEYRTIVRQRDHMGIALWRLYCGITFNNWHQGSSKPARRTRAVLRMINEIFEAMPSNESAEERRKLISYWRSMATSEIGPIPEDADPSDPDQATVLETRASTTQSGSGASVKI